MAFLIFSHMGVAVYETDTRSMGKDLSSWFFAIPIVYTVIYVADMSLRLYTYRKAFLRSRMNLVEIVIVLGDVTSLVVQAVFGNISAMVLLRGL